MLGIVSKQRHHEKEHIMPNSPQEVQDEILSTVRKSQETVVEAIKAWVETVQSVTPKLPSVSVPLADKLPKPEEVVASAYKFAEDMVKALELPSSDKAKAAK